MRRAEQDTCLRARGRDMRAGHTQRWAAKLKLRRKVAAANRRRLRRRFEKYLDLLTNGEGSRRALSKARLTWQEVNRWYGRVPEFRQRIERAKTWGHLLRVMVRYDEMHRRAVDGVPVPVVSAGVHVKGDDGKPLYRMRRSDKLLLKLCRADDPERFSCKGTPGPSHDEAMAELFARITGADGFARAH